MKRNAIFTTVLAVALASGLLFVSCDTGTSSSSSTPSPKYTIVSIEPTSGRLTITSFDKDYEGKYVLADGGIITDYTGQTNDRVLTIAEDVSGTNENNLKMTLGQIIDGKVTLKVWETIHLSETSIKLVDFAETGQIALRVNIFNVGTFGFNEPEAIAHTDDNSKDWFPVYFTNGTGTVSAEDKIKPGKAQW